MHERCWRIPAAFREQEAVDTICAGTPLVAAESTQLGASKQAIALIVSAALLHFRPSSTHSMAEAPKERKQFKKFM
jgi:hypothetical protein